MQIKDYILIDSPSSENVTNVFGYGWLWWDKYNDDEKITQGSLNKGDRKLSQKQMWAIVQFLFYFFMA